MTAIASPVRRAWWRGRPVVTVTLPGDPPVKAAERPPDGLTVPDGPQVRCRGCGRLLRRYSPSGYGPVCGRRHQPATATIPTPRRDDHIPGQGELPLADHQPTLWSP